MKLYGYQKEGVQLIDTFRNDRQQVRCLLADDMGLGKTLQAITFTKKHNLFPFVVICPAFLKLNWHRECTQAGLDNLEIVEGRKWKRKPRKCNMIVNYDLIDSHCEELIDHKFRFAIIDECHYLQNRSAKRTKACRELLTSVPNLLALSGSPLVRPADLWPMLNILRPDIWHDFMEYAMAHCAPKRVRYGGWECKGAVRLGELHRNLKKHVMIRRLKQDVLKELPPKTRTIQVLPLKNEREYRLCEEDFRRWIKQSFSRGRRGRVSRSSNVLTQTNRLKQLAARLKFGAACDWVDNWLDRNPGQKIVLFAYHRACLRGMKKRFPNSVLIHGSTPIKTRDEYVRQFQNDPDTRVLIGQIQAAGTGLTLTAASTVAFFELAWNPDLMDQAADRVHRISQTEHCDIYYLIGANTIEDRVCKILQAKSTVIAKTLDGKRGKPSLNIMDMLIDTYEKENTNGRKV